MREFITEDLISKLRVTRQISFTKRGLVTRSYTELIPDEVIESKITSNDTLIDIPDYVNYNPELSTEEAGGVFVYDYERQIHDDKHEIICFNTTIDMTFEYERDCNNLGIVDYFYIKQTIEDVIISNINVHIKDPYSEGTVANIYVNDDIIVTIPLGVDDVNIDGDYGVVHSFDFDIGTVCKMDIVVVGNTNPSARSEFSFIFNSSPEKIRDMEVNEDDEEVNDDA